MYVFFNIYDIIKFESLFCVFYFDFKIYVLVCLNINIIYILNGFEGDLLEFLF